MNSDLFDQMEAAAKAFPHEGAYGLPEERAMNTFAATCSPTNILALCAEVRRKDAALNAALRWWNEIPPADPAAQLKEPPFIAVVRSTLKTTSRAHERSLVLEGAIPMIPETKPPSLTDDQWRLLQEIKHTPAAHWNNKPIMGTDNPQWDMVYSLDAILKTQFEMRDLLVMLVELCAAPRDGATTVNINYRSAATLDKDQIDEILAVVRRDAQSLKGS